MTRPFIIAATLIVMCLGLGGCSGFDVLNMLAPRGGYTVAADIAYGTDDKQKLDVLTPVAAAGKLPVVVFFYGGSWRSGSRGDYRFAGEAITGLGYVAVVADYRHYPGAKFPAFQNDAAQAVRWVRENIGAYGGDTNAIFIMGHSAGAHIAALTVVDPKYLQAAGAPEGTIKGFIGLAGPYAMIPSQVKDVRDVFAGLPDENVARPVTFVAPHVPPAFTYPLCVVKAFGTDWGVI